MGLLKENFDECVSKLDMINIYDLIGGEVWKIIYFYEP